MAGFICGSSSLQHRRRKAVRAGSQLVHGGARVIQGTTKDRQEDLVDLAGHHISWAPAKSRGAPHLFAKTMADGITLLDQVEHKGEFDVALDAADIIGFAQGAYHHDAYAITPSGKGSVILEGTMRVSLKVRR